jgi:ribonuclease P protein component
VLPRTARLHESADFRRVTRSGVRAGRPTLVVHATTGAVPHSRVGFVVSKAVGGAVVRNRVKRRLRHLVAAELGSTPAGAASHDVVVRALPASAASPDRVPADLASAWSQAMHRLSPGTTRTRP